MTDYEGDALLFAQQNAARNLSPEQFARIRFRALDWRSSADIGRYDIIIAADVVYERRNFIPLLRLTRDSLLVGGVAQFTDPDRSIGHSFRDEATMDGFTVAAYANPVTLQGRTHTIVRYEVRLHTEDTESHISHAY
jgi:hypothetical protein